MTINVLALSLEVNATSFHQEMQSAAERADKTGKRIAEAGELISKALSFPLVAAGVRAFQAALEGSGQSGAKLAAAYAQLKTKIHDVFQSVGQQLTPVFLKLIDAGQRVLDWVLSAVQAFGRLPSGVKSAITTVLLLLAALGPTVVVIGSLIRVLAVLPALFAALATGPGIAVIAIGLLIAAAIAIITHFGQVKVFLLEVWRAIVAGTTAAIDGLLAGFGFLFGWIPKLGDVIKQVRTDFDAWRTSVLKGIDAQIEHAGQTNNANNGIKRQDELFRAIKASVDQYNTAIRQLNGNAALFGPEFNKNAASAQALKQQLDSLIEAGAGFETSLPDDVSMGDLAQRYIRLADAGKLYDDALNALGPTLEDHNRLLSVATQLGINLDTITVAQLNRLKAYGTQLSGVTSALQEGLTSGLEAVGTQLGAIFGGMSHGFKGFGAAIEGILGGMLKTIGHVLIAYGIAGVSIKKFIANPFAAIAAGIALIALGSVLSKAAQSSVDAGGGALAGSGGGGGSASGGGGTASGPQPDQGAGTIVIQGGLLDMSDPRQADALGAALEQLSGRRVVIRGATA